MIDNKFKRYAFLILVLLIFVRTSVYAKPDPKIIIPRIREQMQNGKQEMRGIWFSFNDYEKFGLNINNGEKQYKNNIDNILTMFKEYNINTIFLHVRAFDDAFWKSEYFKASHYIGGDESLIAKNSYPFDPTGIFLEEAHKNGFSVHAWINPYRITNEEYYDPGVESSVSRILTAVNELLEYTYNDNKFDGIHMDDYFYHSKGGYRSSSGSVYGINISAEEKREYVNEMVRRVYASVHSYGKIFGISPAGNYDNDMNSGADIDTWLSEDGYIDYLCPQIYWTNNHGASGEERMFSNRLDLFLNKKKNSAKIYVGLALYRGGSVSSGDPGWQIKSNNIYEQIVESREKGCNGYILFTASSLLEPATEAERNNIREG